MFYRIEKKELDLLAAYNRHDGPTPFELFLKRFGIPLLLIIVIAGLQGFLFFNNMKIENQIKEVKQENKTLQKKIAQCDQEAYGELTSLQETVAATKKIDNYISKLPRLTSTKIKGLTDELLPGMDILSLSYDQTSGIVTISGQSSKVGNIATYVETIKENTDYESVTYKGYQQVSNTYSTPTGTYDPVTGQEITTQSSSTYYTFTLSVVISGGQ